MKPKTTTAQNKASKLFVEREDPVLREVALPIPPEEITSKRIEKMIKLMQQALHAEDDGVAIAAPQIGESLRLFVAKGDVLAMTKKKGVDPKQELSDLIFINPEIIKVSKKKKTMEEGCLSLRYLYGQVERHEKVTIKAYDETGRAVTAGASGLLAQIFQHEIDHLNGILFTDKAENVKDVPPTQHEKA